MSPSEGGRNPLVIGCGALAPELVALTRRSGLPAMDLSCLPATLHNRPEQIPAAVRARIRRARARGYDRIFVAYADCGTGGLLDRVLEAEGVDRLEGAHCYEVFAGREAFAALHDAEPGTFYLTDFLARNFDRLVIRGLGLDRHPELLPLYFGHYRRLVYLAQTDDDRLTTAARRGALSLGLSFERRFTGLGELGHSVGAFAVASGAGIDAAMAGQGGSMVDSLHRVRVSAGSSPARASEPAPRRTLAPSRRRYVHAAQPSRRRLPDAQRTTPSERSRMAAPVRAA